MPIPNTPVTREEVYLNAIATGDSSGLPAYPVTREEMYLDAIAKNGGGGGSGGGVLVVHANMQTGVLDKTWQEIVDAGFAVIYMENSGFYLLGYLHTYGINDSTYYLDFMVCEGVNNVQIYAAAADSATGYPVMT